MRAKGRDLKPIRYEEREDIPLLIQRGQVRIVLRKHQQRPAVHVQKIGIACAERPKANENASADHNGKRQSARVYS